MTKKTAVKQTNAFRSILASSGQAKATPAPVVEKSSSRRLKAGYTQVGANIPKSLKREVFKKLQDEDLSFSALVENLLERWLAA
jgi:hypothetical protein